MKKKGKIIALVSCGVFFIAFVTFIVLFFMGFAKDKQETKEEMKKIQKEYVSFKTSIESYNEVREKVYTSLFDEIYYETMEEKDASNKALLKEAEKVVEEVSKTSKSLKKACEGVIYPDVSINTKCDSFSLAYEQVVNSFVSDVESFNAQLKKYNLWATEKGKPALSNFETSWKYIDYNQDSEYSGKEELTDGE